MSRKPSRQSPAVGLYSFIYVRVTLKKYTPRADMPGLLSVAYTHSMLPKVKLSQNFKE